MNIPTNLYELSDAASTWFQGLRNKAAIKAGRPASEIATPRSSNSVLARALDVYENIAGRFDSPQRIPSRYLDGVGKDEEALLAELGVERDEQGRWVVPEDQDLADYEQWWPKVPEDLLDKTPRLLTTKNGKSIHAYVRPSDWGQGADSTATVLMYAAFPIVAAAVFALEKVLGGLAYVLLLALIPYMVALAYGEGVKNAIKSFAFLAVGPLLLANLTGTPTIGAAGGFLTQGMSSGPLAMAGTVVGTFTLVLVASFVGTIMFGDARKGTLGGTFETFKAAVKWAVFIGLTFWLAQTFLPAFLQPAFWFGLACMWPMKYTNDNAGARAGMYQAHDGVANAHTQGALTNVAVKPKLEQAKRAVADKTPLIVLGTADGWLTRKHYDYAPDEGTKMVLSALDLATHLIVYGMTGSGKTTSVMRPVAKQWVRSGYGGFFCLDGKGSLPGEMSSLFDIMVRPGVDFAPMEGLDGQGVYLALTSLGGGNNMKEGDRIWVDGANDVIDHITQLHWALHTHERNYKAFAATMAQVKELQVDEGELEVLRLDKLGEDTSEAMEDLETARTQLAQWAKVRDGGRRWLWNVHTLIKVLAMVENVDESAGAPRPSKDLLEAADFLGYEAEAKRLAARPQTIHPEVGKQSILDGSLEFLLKSWPNTDFRQRSSFLINVRQRLLPLTRGPHLLNAQGVHWSQLEHGVDVGQCLYGKSVGLDLPATKHGQAGVAVAAFAKQRVYAGMKARAHDPKWREKGGTPVMFMFEEAQLLVGEAERELLPIARSLGGCFVMATQGFEGLEVQFGSEAKAHQFCNTFQSIACLKASQQTYNYMVERLGTAQMMTFKQATVGLDVAAAVRKLADSPLNDVDHPDRAFMRRYQRMGAGNIAVMSNSSAYAGGSAGQRWMGHSEHAIDEGEIAKNIVVPRGGTKEIQPIFKPEEYAALTTTGQGILVLNRAGAPRIDVAHWHPVGEHELRAQDDDEDEQAAAA